MKTELAKRAMVVSLSDKAPEKDKLQLQLQQWVKQVAESQDRQAFGCLFKHFSPLIKSFAYANPFGNSPAQFGEDLLQEVMVKLWNKAGSYDSRHAAVSTWVFTIARNTRIDMIRKASRHEFALDADEIFDMEDENTPQLHEQLAQRQYARDVKKYLSELSNDQAQIVAKVYMEGKSHSQIASELDLPLGTVKSRVRLAMLKLKSLVGV
jgi:RNA polymerase sigma-70 factor (ECF subfamily)